MGTNQKELCAMFFPTMVDKTNSYSLRHLDHASAKSRKEILDFDHE